MRFAIAGRKLNDAQVVASEAQAHGFGIDGHHRPEIKTVRQIAFMIVDAHAYHPLFYVS